MRLSLLFALVASPALAQPMAHDHRDQAAAVAPSQTASSNMMDMGDMADMSDMAPDTSAAPHGHEMSSVLGDYTARRDASGTSWQPDASPAMGGHMMAGDWMVMRHATFDLVHSSQGGPRGGDKTFVGGMVMASGAHDVGDGRVNLRAMLSPEPLMGKAGYPLLLAVGETADGSTHLVDRQHPHDLFMELSASYSQPLESGSAYLYAGLPGEPAFGPPAFMHRPAALTSPEAPISHHWLDSTHITFGVVTAGYVHGDWKIETSAFRGREPDENRYDIESPRLDSGSVRLSWNPTENWALQGSWARLESPEQLEPGRDEKRWSVSALYSRPIGKDAFLSATLAYGAKSPEGRVRRDAALAEASLTRGRWTAFTRAEWTQQDELDAVQTPHEVGKLSVGGVYAAPVNDHVSVGVGALVSAYALPKRLEASYDSPTSGMAFLRLSLH